LQRPAIQKLSTYLGDKLQVLEIDASRQPEVANRWGVLSVPTTFVIDTKGKVRHINHGVAKADQLLMQIQGTA
jgi:peroxiredoxin